MTHTLRNIPSDLHKEWKSISALLGKNMDEVAFEALKKYIKISKVKLAEEISGENYGFEDQHKV